MNYSSAGSGTSQHLAGELFKARTGTYIVHIPTKGRRPHSPPSSPGKCISFANVPAILGHVRSGRLKALAVLAPKRSDLMPDVPTMEEAGVAGVEVPVWYALLGPAALPRDIVKTLNDATVRAARSPDLSQSSSSRAPSRSATVPRSSRSCCARGSRQVGRGREGFRCEGGIG